MRAWQSYWYNRHRRAAVIYVTGSTCCLMITSVLRSTARWRSAVGKLYARTARMTDDDVGDILTGVVNLVCVVPTIADSSSSWRGWRLLASGGHKKRRPARSHRMGMTGMREQKGRARDPFSDRNEQVSHAAASAAGRGVEEGDRPIGHRATELGFQDSRTSGAPKPFPGSTRNSRSVVGDCLKPTVGRLSDGNRSKTPTAASSFIQ